MPPAKLSITLSVYKTISIAESDLFLQKMTKKSDLLCYRIYITYNPLKDEAHYYTIEMTKEKDVRLLGGVTEDAKHVSYGNAPVEGAELQEIMNLAKNPGELTS